MNKPAVSVFMTIRNEAQDLAACVERVINQDYAGDWEFVIAVGPSDDNTAEIATELALRDSRIRIVVNPTGLTPHGLNLAVAAAHHDYLVRVDGHALIDADYLTRIVELLQSTDAANVGGLMVPVGTTSISQAIAHAMSSRFGIGGAAFHTGGKAGPQPTVYLGAFRRAAFESVGGYDEYFLRAQDWELNYRLRKAGYTVWFDPRIGTRYHPRSSWWRFAQQQYRTGGWRRRVIARYPETWSLRYLAPPAATVAIDIGITMGILGLFWPWMLWGFAVPALYVAGVSVIGLFDARRLPWRVRVRVPLAFAIMHMAWGIGFITKAR